MDSKRPTGSPPPDPKTSKPLDFADAREAFERLTTQSPRNSEAERAFIDSRIEMIRTDRTLSEEEKDRLISELKRRLAF